MAKIGKVGDGHRDGMVKTRSQVKSPLSKLWTKRDRTDGKFVDVKTTGGKFKGVRREGLTKAPAARKSPARRKTATARRATARAK